MKNFDQNYEAEVLAEVSNAELEDVIELGEDDLGEMASQKKFCLFTKLLIATLLVVGIPTAALAYTAPDLLEPIASALPDALFPQPGAQSESLGC